MSEQPLAFPQSTQSEAPSQPQEPPEISQEKKRKKTSGNWRKGPALKPSLGPAGGLGLKVRKVLAKELRERGIPEREIPKALRDTEVARSRKGKAGQIIVHQLSGVQKTGGANLARRLENDISTSREELIEKLEASGNKSQALARVVGILQTQPQFSLARAIAEAGADVAQVLDNYAKGALALKKLETVLGLYEKMPHLMRDLARHAIDKEVDCEICLGLGQVTAKTNGTTLNRPCPRCGGSGRSFASSDHKEFAVQKVLEMSEMLPKKAGIQVNQAVQVNQGGPSGGDLLARLSKAADDILYSGSAPSNPGSGSSFGDVIDAEPTQPGVKEA